MELNEIFRRIGLFIGFRLAGVLICLLLAFLGDVCLVLALMGLVFLHCDVIACWSLIQDWPYSVLLAFLVIPLEAIIGATFFAYLSEAERRRNTWVMPYKPYLPISEDVTKMTAFKR